MMTPRFYDARLDDWRQVTQSDVDHLTLCAACFGQALVHLTGLGREADAAVLRRAVRDEIDLTDSSKLLASLRE
jgi:hypothetical protein